MDGCWRAVEQKSGQNGKAYPPKVSMVGSMKDQGALTKSGIASITGSWIKRKSDRVFFRPEGVDYQGLSGRSVFPKLLEERKLEERCNTRKRKC